MQAPQPIPEDRIAPPALAFGALEDSVSFHLRLAQLAAYDAIFAFCPEMKLSLPEQTVLELIAANPEARQGAIADELFIKWPMMTKLVRGLERAGLVERFVPPHDRRSVLLRLTPAGRAALEEVRRLQPQLDAAGTAGLSPGERAALLALLRKVAQRPAAEPRPQPGGTP